MLSFDPYDASIVDDPFPLYARLRNEAPAYYGAAYDFWALSRFDDVKAALSDHETFCSSQGLIVLQATDAYEAPEFPPGNLLLMDPPEHTAYRQLVNRRFLQRAVAELEPRTRATAHRLVDRFSERGTADLVAEFTIALPAIVFGQILGIPDDDVDVFQKWSAQLVSPAPTPEAMAAHHDAAESVSAYFAELLAEKRRHPADDLLSEIAHGELDGEPIGDAEAVGFAIAMLIAGNDTTSNLLATGCGCSPSTATSGRCSPENPACSRARSRRSCGSILRCTGSRARSLATSSDTGARSRPARRCCCSSRRPTGTNANLPSPSASTSPGRSRGT
jgi:cytochrome P450